MSLKRKITSFSQETTLISFSYLFLLFLTLDDVQVKKMAKKAKNTGRNSKLPPLKKFKLILEQNVKKQTYP